MGGLVQKGLGVDGDVFILTADNGKGAVSFVCKDVINIKNEYCIYWVHML